MTSRVLEKSAGKARYAFFFHQLDFAQPLLRPMGPIPLPTPPPRPAKATPGEQNDAKVAAMRVH
jgi:hypothetical protein